MYLNTDVILYVCVDKIVIYIVDSFSFNIDALTRSRNSLPGLKCGTCLPGNATEPPVFGLRPARGGR